MQKILRINSQNQRDLLKKGRKSALLTQKKRFQDYRQWRDQYNSEQNAAIKAERKARREDWIAGPLATDRNTGITRGSYGTVSQTATGRLTKPWSARSEAEKPKHGNSRNIVMYDRVAVIRGPDRGKIGEVSEVNDRNGTITITGVNTADLTPTAMMPEKQREQGYLSYTLALPLDDVRLVTKMYDPENDVEQDVIIRAMTKGTAEDDFHEREVGSSLPYHTRYIAGTNYVIPWPEEEVETQQRHDCDTARKWVDEVTYIPEVGPGDASDPAMPKDVIGEVFDDKGTKLNQMNHEHKYVSLKVIEDARSDWYASPARQLRTPMMEYIEHQKRRQKLDREARMREWQTMLRRDGKRAPKMGSMRGRF